MEHEACAAEAQPAEFRQSAFIGLPGALWGSKVLRPIEQLQRRVVLSLDKISYTSTTYSDLSNAESM